jgi:paraquat-inducible protein A
MADPLIACPECDTLQREIPLPRGGHAECCHCGETLYRSARGGLSHIVALSLAALVLFLIANALPIASLDLGAAGYAETNLAGTVAAVRDQGRFFVALMILWTGIVAPALEIGAMVYMSVPLWLGYCPEHLSLAFRIAPMARTWSLMDVFMLAVAVALVKLGDLATVAPGPALWAFGALIVVLTLIGILFDPREIWLHAEANRAGRRVAEVRP